MNGAKGFRSIYWDTQFSNGCTSIVAVGVAVGVAVTLELYEYEHHCPNSSRNKQPQ